MENNEIINQGELTRLKSSVISIGESVASLLDVITDKTRTGMDVGDLIQMMGVLREIRDLGKEVSAASQNIYDEFSIGVVPLVMEEKGVETVTANGYRLELMTQLRVSVPQESKMGLYDWLREHKLDGMISESVNSSSLKSMVKNALDEGSEFPAHLLKIETYKQAKIVKK